MAGSSLLAGTALAQVADGAAATAAAAAASTGAETRPVYASEGAVILDPVALAILHHARGDASWSSRSKLRGYLKNGGPTGLFGLDPLGSSTAMQLSPQARAIATAWQNVMLSTSVFQRSKDFQTLVALVDAYAARVLNAERYYLALNGQGFLSYDYLDQDLINDAGLVEAGTRFAATRFSTLDHGGVGALQLMNLHVQQLNASLKAPAELHRMPAPDADLAERLLTGKAGTLQLLEVQLHGATPKCFPRAEPMRGTLRPLPGLAVEFLVVDAASGATLYSQPVRHDLRQGRQGYCSVA